MQLKISTRVWAIVLLLLPLFVGVFGSIAGIIYLLTQVGGGVDLMSTISGFMQNPDPAWFERISIVGLILLGTFIIGLILIIRGIGYSQTLPESSIRRGWSLMKQSFWRWVLVLFLGVVVILLYSMLYDIYFTGPNSLVSSGSSWFLIGNIGGMILQIILSALFSIILIGFALDILQGLALQKGYGKLFKRSGVVLNRIIAQIVYNIIVGLGLLLLVVPGIYWAVRFAFWKMFIVDKGYGPIQALRASWAITRGHRWEIAIFKVYETLIHIPGLLLLGLGLFATIPTALLAYTDLYQKLGIQSGKFGFVAGSGDFASDSTDSNNPGGEVEFDDSWENEGEVENK